MQNRRGARITQPYRNLSKLFHKDEVVSHDASWIFLAAPYVVFTLTLVIASSIPITSVHFAAPAGDILVFVYCIACAAFFLALAGLDTGSAFGGTGSSREMTLAALAEGGLLFSLLVLAFMTGSPTMNGIAERISQVPFSHIIPVVISFAVFFVILLSENARYPFDNPATHLELTMVHEAMILEYSGKRLALMEWAAANKLFIFCIVAVNLFFPPLVIGGMPPATTIGISAAVTLVKSLLLACGIACIESSMPKLRFFRLPDVLFTAFVLALTALIVSLIF